MEGRQRSLIRNNCSGRTFPEQSVKTYIQFKLKFDEGNNNVSHENRNDRCDENSNKIPISVNSRALISNSNEVTVTFCFDRS